MFTLVKFVFVLLSWTGALPSAHASSCCGSNTTTPAMISGDEKVRLSLLTSQSQRVGWVDDSGRSYIHDPSSVTQIIRPTAAMLLTDRFQVGLDAPLVRTASPSSILEEAFGLGDLRGLVGYEFLPEYGYEPWIPKGYVFTSVTFPTSQVYYTGGPSPYGSQFLSFGLGLNLSKQWTFLDVVLVPYVALTPATTRHGIRFSNQVQGSLLVGAGVRPLSGPLRIGLSLNPIYTAASSVSTESDTRRNPASFVMNTAASLNYLFVDNWSANLSYADQTLLGPAQGTLLTRTVALAIQHSWDR